jgi:hypothetical protein
MEVVISQYGTYEHELELIEAEQFELTNECLGYCNNYDNYDYNCDINDYEVYEDEELLSMYFENLIVYGRFGREYLIKEYNLLEQYDFDVFEADIPF